MTWPLGGTLATLEFTGGSCKMYESLAEQATESDWSQEEKRAWYRERRDDAEYYRVQRDLLRNGLTRKAKLAHLPPVREGDPLLWAIGLDGASPLKRRRHTRWATMARTRGATGPARCMSASNKEMEERRAHGFRVRPSYSQVLGYFCHLSLCTQHVSTLRQGLCGRPKSGIFFRCEVSFHLPPPG